MSPINIGDWLVLSRDVTNSNRGRGIRFGTGSNDGVSVLAFPNLQAAQGYLTQLTAPPAETKIKAVIIEVASVVEFHEEV